MMSPIAKTPITHLKSGSDETYLITTEENVVEKTPVAELEVRAKEQPHISLGSYTAANSPKGFAIHISPDPEPETIVTRITRLGTDKKYELVLHIANYGNVTVSAEIWRL